MCFAAGAVCHYEIVRMNPESKTPSPEMPEGDEKFRLLVMDHLEPDEWNTGEHDAPVVGDSTFRQLIAAGLKEDNAWLKGTLENRKRKPASRKMRQLWRKLLVTDQDRFNAEAGQHPGQDSGENPSNGARKKEGQASKIKCQEQHGQGDGDARPSQCDPNNSGTTVAQVICGITERVTDVVMTSSDDHGGEVKADLGRNMHLPEKGGTSAARLTRVHGQLSPSPA